MNEKVREYNKIRLEAYLNIVNILQKAKAKTIDCSLANLPEYKQEEFRYLLNELSRYVLNRLKEHDFYPSYICLQEGLGTISLLSEIKNPDAE